MIDIAYAQGGGVDAGSPLGMFVQFLPILLVFVIFYFLLIRPQTKRQRELRKMVENLKRGDRVLTSGGLYGEVMDLKEKSVVLKIADNVKAEFTKQSVVGVDAKS